MQKVETSIIIPLFNQWKFTRNCLKSLAASVNREHMEVIAIDNASTDSTADACPFLGKQLFGANFKYIRNGTNRNFAGACNQGAMAASGVFLIFLNNDTEVLPGWHELLIKDLKELPNLAAVGPTLLYPPKPPFGHTIQHLGTFVSPFYSLGHLYTAIPADSPLAKKRRFFQAITAACMAIPKKLFLNIGMFDENFINGFEDADLCARLWTKGYRMSVNPEARVIHHESQTPGRGKHEEKNSIYFAKKSLHLLTPDLHYHLQQDGLELKISDWLSLTYGLAPQKTQRLNALSDKSTYAAIKNLLVINPFWREGFHTLIAKCENDTERNNLKQLEVAIFNDRLQQHLTDCERAIDENDKRLLIDNLNPLTTFLLPPETYRYFAFQGLKQMQYLDLQPLIAQYQNWLANFEHFKDEIHKPLIKKYLFLAKKLKLQFLLNENCAYTEATYGSQLAGQLDFNQSRTNTSSLPGISLVLPVYNSNPNYLQAAINSVLGQDFPYWELCIADDASTDPQIKQILTEYAAKDKRLKIVWLDKRSHMAQAANSALALATNPYVVLLEQGSLLERDALAAMAKAILANPRAMFFFSDEDRANDAGEFLDTYLKNGRWDWELLPVQNFGNQLAMYRLDRIKGIGGFRDGFPGAYAFDLLLRYLENMQAKDIIHIPQVLYHWRPPVEDISTGTNTKPCAQTGAPEAFFHNVNGDTL